VNQYTAVAVAWHVVILAGLVLLGFGWRPSNRLGAVALGAPALSVSGFAFTSGNPFNGTVFALLAIALAIAGSGAPQAPVRLAAPWATGAGALLIAFGLVYPHFLEGTTPLRYFYAAPTGLIPCPTLSLLIGFSLVADGFQRRAVPLLLGVVGLLYGVFGVFRLGVHLDVVLAVGAVAVLARGLGLDVSRRLPSALPDSAAGTTGQSPARCR
jgi:hypothetical protein